MKNIAIIPARSGSKGLKDKNIKLLHGKPLIAYTIEAAQKSKIFDEIFVSTDSEDYAIIAKEWGASVPFLRSEELSSDSASSWDVVSEVLQRYTTEQGKKFDTFALLQPTSPLRTSKDIINGYSLMKETKANVIISVCEVEHSPMWSNTLKEDKLLKNFLNKEVLNKRRQDLEKYYRINGALYILKTGICNIFDELYGAKSYALIMSKSRSIDIDDYIDFMLAELLVTNTRVE